VPYSYAFIIYHDIYFSLLFYTSELLPNIFGVTGTYNQCLRTNNPTKTSWYDKLVGLTAEEAKKKINRPEADIQVELILLRCSQMNPCLVSFNFALYDYIDANQN
jgi:alkylhydroperoxidase family enzyme